MNERREAKRDFKVGMAHVGSAADYCAESGDAELARAFYRDLMHRASELARACNLDVAGISDRRQSLSAVK